MIKYIAKMEIFFVSLEKLEHVNCYALCIDVNEEFTWRKRARDVMMEKCILQFSIKLSE